MFYGESVYGVARCAAWHAYLPCSVAVPRVHGGQVCEGHEGVLGPSPPSTAVHRRRRRRRPSPCSAACSVGSEAFHPCLRILRSLVSWARHPLLHTSAQKSRFQQQTWKLLPSTGSTSSRLFRTAVRRTRRSSCTRSLRAVLACCTSSPDEAAAGLARPRWTPGPAATSTLGA